jgi:hypothetical protein
LFPSDSKSPLPSLYVVYKSRVRILPLSFLIWARTAVILISAAGMVILFEMSSIRPRGKPFLFYCKTMHPKEITVPKERVVTSKKTITGPEEQVLFMNVSFLGSPR